ncbi:MAG: hypothetical protein ABIS01_09475 [Ferruginibacter sp.]
MSSVTGHRGIHKSIGKDGFIFFYFFEYEFMDQYDIRLFDPTAFSIQDTFRR